MAKHIEAAGGVLFRITAKKNLKVLLIKRNGFWDIPKGKLEKGESIPDCAAREVYEEIGLKDMPMIISKLCDTTHRYQFLDTHFEKTTYWYSMYTPERKFTPQEIEGITRIKWVKLDKAIDKVGFDNLKDVLNTFKKWWYTT